MDVSSLNLALPAAGAGAPEWVHLVPAGTFRGETGGQVYHLKDPAAVIAASMTAGKLALDENHSTQRAPDSGSPSPARAWIVELQNRTDGIWGRPEWNPSGVALMTDGAYRNISPVFKYDLKGNVTRILSAALTNNPNLAELTAMHTQPAGDEMEKNAICTALGIAPTTDDASVLVALHTAREAAHALATAQAELAALKATTVPATEMVALQTQLSTLVVERNAEKASAFVDAAIKQGKPIAPVRAQMIALHTQDQASTEALINGMVSINAGGTKMTKVPAGPSGEGQVEMTAEEMAICSKMGVDPKKYADQRKTSEGSAA